MNLLRVVVAPLLRLLPRREAGLSFRSLYQPACRALVRLYSQRSSMTPPHPQGLDDLQKGSWSIYIIYIYVLYIHKIIHIYIYTLPCTSTIPQVKMIWLIMRILYGDHDMIRYVASNFMVHFVGKGPAWTPAVAAIQLEHDRPPIPNQRTKKNQDEHHPTSIFQVLESTR